MKRKNDIHFLCKNNLSCLPPVYGLPFQGRRLQFIDLADQMNQYGNGFLYIFNNIKTFDL
jgi:hypothetical protein